MEFEIYCPSPECIRKIADGTGLSYNTIKKEKMLSLFNNSFEDLKKSTEKKFTKDLYRAQINEMKKHGFINEIRNALTSVEEIILKALEENCKFKDDYNSWFKLGVNIKFFYPNEKGLNLFKSVSSLSEKYNEKECEKFFQKLSPEYGNAGVIVNLIEREKFTIPKNRKNYLLQEQKKTFLKILQIRI